MRILLCQSYNGSKKGEPLVFPLGLAYLASLLKEKHEVRCWDPNCIEIPFKHLPNILHDFEPNVVGVSLRNIDNAFSFNKVSYYPQFVSLIKAIKKNMPSCKLVVGGTGFSLFAEEIMKRNPEIDFGLISEGEYPFFELIENIEHPEKVKNLFFRIDKRLVFTGRQGFVDFDKLPSPSREFFDLEKYKDIPYSMGVQSKRGCSFRCIYCPNWFFVGTDYRLKSPKKVVDEIEELVEKYGFNTFYFVDTIFNVPLDHARKICREMVMRKLDIKWRACFRPDFVNAEFMRGAIKAGCDLFDFSPDGASDGALQVLGKDLKVEHIEKTINLVNMIENANVSYNFLYDLPEKNREHVMGLLSLVPKILRRCNSKVHFISFSKIRIYPHTRLYEITLRQGQINKNTDLVYPVHYESKCAISLENFLPYFLRKTSILFKMVVKNPKPQ